MTSSRLAEQVQYLYAEQMGIWDRLGQLFKSYINDDDTLYRDRRSNSYGDPDLNDAFDELNDYLDKGKTAEDRQQSGAADFTSEPFAKTGKTAGKQVPPEELRRDFSELELTFGASSDECKEAYKRLLKIHHPDRHANHEGNFKKASEKTLRLNAAYERICKWRADNS